MIELRWRLAKGEDKYSVMSLPIGLCTKGEDITPLVLQVRQAENLDDIGLHTPVCGGWYDVPIQKTETDQ